MSSTSASTIPRYKKALEVETLKYGLTNTKIIEKVYALQKDADASRVLDTARAEKQAQTHKREVEKIRRDHNLGESKSAEELRQQKKPFSKKSKASSDGRTKISTTAKDADANTVPNSALPTRKNAVNAKKRATLLNSAVARQTPILPASDLASRNKDPPGLKKKFHEATVDSGGSEADFSEYDTDEVTVQVDSIEAKAEETKSTKTHFAKKMPKHVTKVYLDETLVCVFPSLMLIWALQRSQNFKIRVAQHWGGRGHITVRTNL